MNTELLLGDEAIALGAIHAGLSVAFSYPGTPASEIMEFLIKSMELIGGFKASWCVNEKVAFEEALGVSYTGKKTMVSMKHVGLNVAADPFMNSALIKINGGLVVVVADDPGMHSSQNEQDSRYYADFARIFCFEPSDHQEAYDMTREAFSISERFGIPVMIRIVTRLSHSRSKVKIGPPLTQNPPKYGKKQEWTLLPANSRKQFKLLIDIQPELKQVSMSSDFNALQIAGKSGIITSGVGYNYVKENIDDLKEKPSLLKVSTFPLPQGLIERLADHVESMLVVEDGYPFIEERIMGMLGIDKKKINGKLNGYLPQTGELTPDLVRKAMGLNAISAQNIGDFKLPGRPPQLCQGCPHADTFRALTGALAAYDSAVVFSDIGCYTLGALPPYEAVDTCVCMGASVSMAKGSSDAGLYPAVAMIGDSTFAHSGITPLLDAARKDTNMTLIIVDNASVAMTGGQPTFVTGEGLVRIASSVGIPQEHIQVIVPLPKNFEENKKVIEEEIDHSGLSVIISSRECVQETRKRAKKGAK